MLGDEDSAVDAVQETMISAFRKLNTFHGVSIKHWLTQMIVNICYDELSRKYRRRIIPLERVSSNDEEMEPGLWMADPTVGPEEDCESQELERAIETYLRALAPHFRTVLVLFDIEEYSYEEAAAIIGIPVNTIKSWLARVRMKIREELQRLNE